MQRRIVSADSLLAVDRDFIRRVFLVVLDEPRALHEHAARSARGVKDPPVVWLDDFDDELDDGGRREEFAALLSLLHREIAEEVFVNFPEDITFDVHWNQVEILEEGDERVFFKAVVCFRKNIFQFLVLRLYRLHGVIHCPADVRTFWQVEQR